jgi:murein DD-endopeptidase MepM/ murein hydrolase activator NlpD
VLRVSCMSLALLASTAAGPLPRRALPSARPRDDEFAFVAYARGPLLPQRAASVQPARAAVQPSVPETKGGGATAGVEVITGTVRPGRVYGDLLAASGVPKLQIRQINQALRQKFNPRNAAAGDSFVLTRKAAGELVAFAYQHGRSEVFRVLPTQSGRFDVVRSEAPVERRIARLGGVVETSLLQSVLDQGERGDLVDRLSNIFVWQLDFAQESQPGDEYRLLFEKYYDAQGFVRYGKILAAEYLTPEADLTAIYYENERGHGDYYAPSGRSLHRSFLRFPLRFTRVSSGYSPVRLHPVLHRLMSHRAIDYAAPMGAPVWVVADGKVSAKGWMGALGRAVVVEHANGCLTYYGHLSRYAEGVEIGSRVRQKRVVGYVGDSGLATGPHLHFCMKCGGRFVDPAQASLPDDGSPIRMEELFAFERVKQRRMAELRTEEPPLMLQAGM